MKDIKSVMIGFLLATCMFLFIGATSNTGQGKYQGFGTEGGRFMLDTQTGQLYEMKGYTKRGAIWKKAGKFDNRY